MQNLMRYSGRQILRSLKKRKGI